MSRYSEKLRDPRWQIMRLRVMERANFACERCGDTKTTFNVHHTYYERGRDPWDYPINSLQCLCENCHSSMHASLDELKDFVAGMDPGFAARVLGYARCFSTLWANRPTQGVVIPLTDEESLIGALAAFSPFSVRITPEVRPLADAWIRQGWVPFDALTDLAIDQRGPA